MMALLSFATSRVGLCVLAGLAVAVALAWTYLEGREAGAASVAAAALAEAARRAQAAARARASVDTSREAVERDPHNRDSHR